MSVLLEAEIRDTSEVKKVKSQGGEQKEQKVKFLRLDNGGEYTSSKFKEYLTMKVLNTNQLFQCGQNKMK